MILIKINYITNFSWGKIIQVFFQGKSQCTGYVYYCGVYSAMRVISGCNITPNFVEFDLLHHDANNI